MNSRAFAAFAAFLTFSNETDFKLPYAILLKIVSLNNMVSWLTRARFFLNELFEISFISILSSRMDPELTS